MGFLCSLIYFKVFLALTALRSSYFSLPFAILIAICFHVVLSKSTLFITLLASWICKAASFQRMGSSLLLSSPLFVYLLSPFLLSFWYSCYSEIIFHFFHFHTFYFNVLSVFVLGLLYQLWVIICLQNCLQGSPMCSSATMTFSCVL